MSANTSQRSDALAVVLADHAKRIDYHRERGEHDEAGRWEAERADTQRRAADGWRPPEPDSPGTRLIAEAIQRQNLHAARERAPGAKLTYLRRSLRVTRRKLRRTTSCRPLLARGRPRASRQRRRPRRVASRSAARDGPGLEPPGGPGGDAAAPVSRAIGRGGRVTDSRCER